MKKLITGLFIAGSVVVIIIILSAVFLNSDSFRGLKGEILVMQNDYNSLYSMYIYDAKKRKAIETPVVFFCDAQYNPNNKGKSLIGVFNNNGIAEIYEIIIYKQTSFTKDKLLYRGKNIRYPKFVPNKNTISFIENNELTYYDLDTKESIVISTLPFFEVDYLYDWLDSDTVLYTDRKSDEKSDIVAYRISDGKTHVFKENASNPVLSYNKEFLAYQTGSTVIKDKKSAALRPILSLKIPNK